MPTSICRGGVAEICPSTDDRPMESLMFRPARRRARAALSRQGDPPEQPPISSRPARHANLARPARGNSCARSPPAHARPLFARPPRAGASARAAAYVTQSAWWAWAAAAAAAELIRKLADSAVWRARELSRPERRAESSPVEWQPEQMAFGLPHQLVNWPRRVPWAGLRGKLPVADTCGGRKI